VFDDALHLQQRRCGVSTDHATTLSRLLLSVNHKCGYFGIVTSP
jgi:hypothetical protein